MNTQSLVSWNYNLHDHKGYILERSMDLGSTWEEILNCPKSITTYTDENLWWNDEPWYRVRTYNDYGMGPMSEISKLVIQSPSIETPVLSGEQVAPYTTNVMLEWEFNGSPGGNTVSYSLERSLDGGNTWNQQWDVDKAEIAFLDDTLTEILPFNVSYRIKAAMDFGLNSEYSNIVTINMEDAPEEPSLEVPDVTAELPHFYIEWNFTQLESGEIADFNEVESIQAPDPVSNTSQYEFIINSHDLPLAIESITVDGANFEQPENPDFPYNMEDGPLSLFISSSSDTSGEKTGTLTITPTVGEPYILQLKATYPELE